MDEFDESTSDQDMPVSSRAGRSANRSRRGLTTAIVVVLIAATLAAAGGAYYLYTQEQSKQEIIAQADEHLIAVGTAIDKIDSGWEEFALAESDEASEAFATGMQATTSTIETARVELDAAEAQIQQLPDSSLKTEYLETVRLTRESVDAYEKLFTGMGDTMVISTRLAALGDEMDDSRTALNEAVEEIDDGDYSDGKEKAQRAQNSYETVADLYRELAEQYPASEADKLAAIAELNATQAEYAVEMAETGKTGTVGEFNSYVEKYSAVNDEIRELPLPSWAADVTLLTAESTALLEEATTKRDEALAAYDRAQDMFAAGEY